MKKRVLILSKKTDLSTVRVMKWLLFWDRSTIHRLNQEDDINIVELSIGNKESMVLKKDSSDAFDLSTMDVFWFRRGFVNLKANELTEEGIADNSYSFLPALHDYLKKELAIIQQYFHNRFDQLTSPINSHLKRHLNKIVILELAEQCGLKIPDFLITSSKKELIQFIEKNKSDKAKTICKPIGEILSVNLKGVGTFRTFTSLIEEDRIADLPQRFFPSLFQKFIPKKLELRVFYLSGQCFPMAMFTQTNDKTKVDSRNYDYIKPNRFVPFNLDQSICTKIDKLMKSINLKSGSIDMIWSTNGEFVFLEVNPVGQFRGVSHACNYHLEKRIAELIVNKQSVIN